MNKISYLLALFIFLICNVAFVFSQNRGSPYLDSSSPQYKELMTVLDEDYRSPSEGDSGAKDARNHYTWALEAYNQKKYDQAITHCIAAIKLYGWGWGIFYYQLGLCLMDLTAYDPAMTAFDKAIDKISNAQQQYFELYPDLCLYDLYSLDNNGAIREIYFSYYNIGCMYSLLNNSEQSRYYILQAIMRGYPYIEHIRNDPDLKNLMGDDRNARGVMQEIQQTYNRGSLNSVAGKAYKHMWLGAPEEYYFKDEKRVYHFGGGVGTDDASRIDGTYEIKNYLIFVSYTDFYTEYKRKEIWYVADFLFLEGRASSYSEIAPSELTALKEEVSR